MLCDQVVSRDLLEIVGLLAHISMSCGETEKWKNALALLHSCLRVLKLILLGPLMDANVLLAFTRHRALVSTTRGPLIQRPLSRQLSPEKAQCQMRTFSTSSSTSSRLGLRINEVHFLS